MRIFITLLLFVSLSACHYDDHNLLVRDDFETGTKVVLSDLPIGSCVITDQGYYVREVVETACNKLHDFQVAGSFERDEGIGAEYPGTLELEYESYEKCQSIFESYTGIPFWQSKFDISTVTPSASTWRDGDREVTCLLVDTDGNALASSRQL